MVRLLLSAALFLASAAIGLGAALLLVDEMSVDLTSFIFVVVIFAVLQSVLAPFMARVAARNAPALLGGVGLITTVVSLLITTQVSDGLTIDGGIGPWLLASLVVWLVTMLATLLLPFLLAAFGVKALRENRGGAPVV
ncbi:phage holin family protein [Ornithinimicrobium sediminis]|uniref:phage holin family protein n=1 Tax=Ornithinimicrobium sediminis TaxID=2904603 RepID=UPI001E2FE618|nr:phage holin family protein [Ornithinimicrobium sediminis]MCE0487804.1 phage holin family protein [Ornithinimicrobium sediminis]